MYNFAYMTNNVKSQVFQLEPWKHQPGWTEVIWELVQLTTEKKNQQFQRSLAFVFVHVHLAPKTKSSVFACFPPHWRRFLVPNDAAPSSICFPGSQVGCLNWWIDMLVRWVKVDVLITTQPPDKGPNQSIPSMYVFTYMFGWFFMVNVGKYVIHGCSGMYIYIYVLYTVYFFLYILYRCSWDRFNSKILHHQKSTMGWKFLGYILSRLTWYTLWNYLPAVAIKSEELLYTSPRKKKIFQLLHNQYVPFNH